MGPESPSLAQLFRGLPRELLLLSAFAAGPALAQEPAGPPPPVRPSGVTEVQEVRRVQLDVSVIDPKKNEFSSVPGLAKEDFVLRVDHERLSPEEFARVEFDQICPEPAAAGELRDAALADDRPTLIVLADLNYLDLRMRRGVARALHDLAELAKKRPVRVKVIAYGRRLVPLTQEFTSDPRAIEEAAQSLVELPASGPKIGGLKNVPAPEPGATKRFDPTPLAESSDSGAPVDPEVAYDSAFAVEMPRETGAGASVNISLPEESRTTGRAAASADARPSLSAIEAVLLSHAGIRGRKAVVLFSSSWFDVVDDVLLSYVADVRRAAQSGFTIWSVDARGLSGGAGSYHSRVLGLLSSTTGGDVISSAGRLAVAFDRAIAQLSCYYLFSIPMQAPAEGSREHDIDVNLDTEKHPEYWRYRVRTASTLGVDDARHARERRRLAGLMQPDAHRFPEVRITATYPRGAARESLIEVGTVLSDLTFGAQRERSGVFARLSIEGLVTDESGRVLCRIGDGVERTIRSDQQPARFPPSLVVFRTRCALPGPGTYEVRAVVEDLTSNDIGAGDVQLLVADTAGRLARVSGIRLGRNSGRDFLVDAPAAKAGAPVEVERDRDRRGFVPLLPAEGLATQDRVMIRFVLCGPPAMPLVALRGSALGAETPVLPVSRVGAGAAGPEACREFESAVPEGTLAPGEYRFSIFEAAAGPEGRSVPGQRLAEAAFRIIAPPPVPVQPSGNRAAVAIRNLG